MHLGGVYVFSPSALDKGEWKTPRLGRFIPGKWPRYPCVEGWLGPRFVLEECG